MIALEFACNVVQTYVAIYHMYNRDNSSWLYALIHVLSTYFVSYKVNNINPIEILVILHKQIDKPDGHIVQTSMSYEYLEKSSDCWLIGTKIVYFYSILEK